MKKVVSALCFGAALAAAALPAAEVESGAAELEKIRSELTGGGKHPWIWVFYGDSITHGAVHTHGWRSFPEIFQERIRTELERNLDTVINSGNSGQATDSLVKEEQFELQVRRHHPNVVFILAGMNDARGGVSEQQFRTNLEKLIAMVRGAGAIPVLQTCNTIELWKSPDGSPPNAYYQGYIDRFNNLPRYMEIVRETARRHDVILIDHFRHWNAKAADPEVLHEWLGETIHPGPRGHLEMAELIFRKLGIYSGGAACLNVMPRRNAAPADLAGSAALFDGEVDWALDYRAESGIPGADRWESGYAPGRLNVIERDGASMLQIDNDDPGAEWAMISLRDRALPAGLTGLVLLETRLVFPAVERPGKPWRLLLTLAVGPEEELCEAIVQLSPTEFSGSFGSGALEVGDRPFTLRLLLDTENCAAAVWVDGQYCGTRPVKRLSEERARISFGDGSASAGGVVLMEYLRVGTPK